jgi:3-oxoacyl-[acyl-carrier protein] reductase
MTRFDEQVAIVTGAATGIGYGIARRLASDGARLVMVDIDGELGEQSASELSARGTETRLVVGDVSDQSTAEAAVEAALDAWGRIDILVNNAGITGIDGNIWEISLEEMDRVYRINLRGVFAFCHAVIPSMLDRDYGRIVNIASTAANNARYEGGAYCAAKAGVVQLTKVLALELGEYGITVNAVGPGFTETPATVESSDEYRSNFLAQVPAGRSGRTSDIANAVLFLASPLAEYVNGQAIYVDGGYSAGKLTVRG